MKIAVDLDDVLADSMTVLIKFHNNTYNTALKKSEFLSTRFWETWGGTRDEAIQKVYDFYKTSYFKDTQPIRNSISVIKKLKENNDLFIITSRQYCIEKETINWVEKYFPGIFTKIFFTNHYSQSGDNRKKSDVCDRLNVDVLIEDSLDYAMECLKADRKIILFKCPWNIDGQIQKGIYPVNGWNEVMEII
ncbi:MAG: hypothetical protein U9Q67_00375 [Patescibacteria group bacterium]|nr:hypothetical protein [Patescibacteria group bacterium]